MNQSQTATAALNADTPPIEHLSFIFKNQKIIKDLNKQIKKAENNALSAFFAADKAFRAQYDCALPRGEEASNMFIEDMISKKIQRMRAQKWMDSNPALQIAKAIAPYAVNIAASKSMINAIKKCKEFSIVNYEVHSKHLCLLVDEYVDCLLKLNELYENRIEIDRLAMQEVVECAAIGAADEENPQSPHKERIC